MYIQSQTHNNQQSGKGCDELQTLLSFGWFGLGSVEAKA
jgi:hypothetical protein